MKDDFFERNKIMCEKMYKDEELAKVAEKFIDISYQYEYPYHFTWLGMPIIQYPADIIAFQEVVYKVKPDYIIETGVARGGSMVFYASLLEMIGNKHGKVIGIDIDLREHNRRAIEEHCLNHRIEIINGSSDSKDTFEKVKQIIPPDSKVVVILDSYHTHEHVLKELQLYSNLVGKGSYIIVAGTIIEFVENKYSERPWKKGNNPHTAMKAFLQENKRFEIDETYDQKLLITDCRNGFLRCVEDEANE